eukprot:6171998-Pleurochrysis_carterae.AAC.1
MRLEAMGRDGGALVKAAQAAVKLTLHMGGTGVNIPNKGKKDSPMRMLHELASALPADSLRLLCMHYSMKHNYAGSSAKTKAAFENFCDEARRRNVGQILLVSGAGPRPFDSVACLQQLSLPQENCPEIGVAFNPYIPDRAAREKERARLRLKVNTGRVSCIWLQLGTLRARHKNLPRKAIMMRQLASRIAIAPTRTVLDSAPCLNIRPSAHVTLASRQPWAPALNKCLLLGYTCGVEYRDPLLCRGHRHSVDVEPHVFRAHRAASLAMLTQAVTFSFLPTACRLCARSLLSVRAASASMAQYSCLPSGSSRTCASGPGR